MFSIDKRRIHALSIVQSAGCNLGCEYCAIHQSRNKFSAELAKNTAEALDNGEFLNNMKQALLRLKVPFTQIEQISFWGQEPTLTLHIFNKHMEDWFATFPNIKRFVFSTNIIAYPDRIVEFIQKVDKCSKLPCCLDLQLSYDGEWSTFGLRKTEPSNILKNIHSIITQCNSIMLNNTIVQFGCHGVLSRDLINSLDTYDKIRQYLINSDQDICSLAASNINKNIYFHPTLSLGIETPVDASTEDGLKLTNFLTSALYVQESELQSGVNTIRGFLRQFTRYADICHACNSANILEFLTKVQTEVLNGFEYEHMHQSTFCSNNLGEIKILYDGTLINCQNFLNDTKKEFLRKTGNDLKDEIRASLIEHNYFVNLIHEPQQQVIDNLFYMSELAHDDSFLFMYQQVLENMKALAAVGQISPDYLRDEEKLLLHAMIMTCAQPCGYTSYIMSGSLLLRDIGAIRFFANGTLDLIDKVRLQEEKGAKR